MTLVQNTRAWRAVTTMLACALLALAPAVADAAKLKRAPKTTKANAGVAAGLGLSATTQLAAMNTALNAGPAFFAGRSTGCAVIVPLLTTRPGSVIAGNFRDAAGACYVWLNLAHSDMLSGPEICKTTLHEFGHLTGLEHSSDPRNVMFAPFVTDPIPAACQAKRVR
jgi:Matrixin